jgi:hypothetical protein
VNLRINIDGVNYEDKLLREQMPKIQLALEDDARSVTYASLSTAFTNQDGTFNILLGSTQMHTVAADFRFVRIFQGIANLDGLRLDKDSETVSLDAISVEESIVKRMENLTLQELAWQTSDFIQRNVSVFVGGTSTIPRIFFSANGFLRALAASLAIARTGDSFPPVYIGGAPVSAPYFDYFPDMSALDVLNGLCLAYNYVWRVHIVENNPQLHVIGKLAELVRQASAQPIPTQPIRGTLKIVNGENIVTGMKLTMKSQTKLYAISPYQSVVNRTLDVPFRGGELNQTLVIGEDDSNRDYLIRTGSPDVFVSPTELIANHAIELNRQQTAYCDCSLLEWTNDTDALLRAATECLFGHVRIAGTELKHFIVGATIDTEKEIVQLKTISWRTL